jgi:hypothetical protein
MPSKQSRVMLGRFQPPASRSRSLCAGAIGGQTAEPVYA